jgi:predicted ATPase
MKIKIKNLGALKQAEFTLGDLTIICGCNNTGKTYATYALFGFLYTWRRRFSIKINGDKIEQLLADGVISLDIQEYVEQSEPIVAKGCQAYTEQLPKIFAAQADRFKETEFQVRFDTKNIRLTSKFDRKISTDEISLSLLQKVKKVRN